MLMRPADLLATVARHIYGPKEDLADQITVHVQDVPTRPTTDAADDPVSANSLFVLVHRCEGVTEVLFKAQVTEPKYHFSVLRQLGMMVDRIIQKSADRWAELEREVLPRDEEFPAQNFGRSRMSSSSLVSFIARPRQIPGPTRKGKNKNRRKRGKKSKG